MSVYIKHTIFHKEKSLKTSLFFILEIISITSAVLTLVKQDEVQLKMGKRQRTGGHV